MSAYYNEINPYAAQWLRNLMAAGHIPDGYVDNRSIEEVEPHDLFGFDRCHFFAGVGGWAHAARLAGWPDDRPLWTGSCPCQPWSVAGKQKGHDDERDLWPHYRRLVEACRPPVLAGEQVASPLGRGWLSGVRSDLEAMGYDFWAADLCAAGVGAPHIRQRLYWVGDADRERPQRHGGHLECPGERTTWARLQEPDWKEFAGSVQLFPDGVSSRVGTLRAAGNTVVPRLAAAVLMAYDAT